MDGKDFNDFDKTKKKLINVKHATGIKPTLFQKKNFAFLVRESIVWINGFPVFLFAEHVALY